MEKRKGEAKSPTMKSYGNTKGDVMKKANKLETIVGFVEETDEDDVVGVIISTDEEPYIVEMNKQGKRLLQEVGSEVEATGEVTRDKDGNKTISIRGYEVFEDEDEDDDYDEDDRFYDDDRDDWDEDRD
jgi:hypothetical protein